MVGGTASPKEQRTLLTIDGFRTETTARSLPRGGRAPRARSGDRPRVETAVPEMLREIVENPYRNGLLTTPARRVAKNRSDTVTSAFRGSLQTDASLQREALALIGARSTR